MNRATLYQVNEDGSTTQRWELGEGPIVVGRSDQAKVSVADDGVSRRHFLIEHAGDGYVIRDLNSRNGTWIHGCRIFTERLRHDDCIRAGNTQFRFADRAGEASVAVRPEEGPHGTRIICRAPDSTGDFPDLSPWEDAVSPQQC
jgi:pSer/pThr/pTyr-binding forkhead associated (FHA) protein